MDISYKGTDHHGWQSQVNANSIQEDIQIALAKILRLDKIELTGSGRTDTGVHAQQQIAHFDINDVLDIQLIIHKLNSMLNENIAINKIFPVKDNAHARFDAIRRTYNYHIHTIKNPFKTATSYYFKFPLDTDRINKACEIIKKWNDFESFSKVKTEVSNFNCDIYEASWSLHNEDHIFIVSANRFLRNMVRAMVGTLIEIGQKKLSLPEFEKILKDKNRSSAGVSVPANGLFLSEVTYPDSIYN